MSDAVRQWVALATGRLLLVVALVLLFAALTALAAVVLGYFTRGSRAEEVLRRRLEFYTIGGRQPRRALAEQHATRLGENAVARGAVSLAGRVISRQGLDQVMNRQLETAGLPLRTEEWLLLHVGTAVGLAIVLQIVSGGSLPATVIGLGIGLAAPWAVLSLLSSRRRDQFQSQLPDTLQLIAGGLQAGYSVPQALDSVVREGVPPISTEFNRALVEARLGKPVEDALDSIGQRLGSRDFSWVVMAIRIQREVGGNLAELLLIVADTMRERERLRRQVDTLSSEGRLSGIVLLAIPVLLLVFLTISQPAYVGVLYTTPLGLLLLGVTGVLMAVGAVWMAKVIKVEV